MNMGFRKIVCGLLAAIICANAHAAPCSGVNRVLGDADRQSFAAAIPGQLKPQLPDIASVRILEYFSYKDWKIIHVDTQVSDEAYLVYHGSPLDSTYLDLLAGAYTMYDGPAIVAQLTKGKSKGIPAKLARCIAWHIIKG